MNKNALSHKTTIPPAGFWLPDFINCFHFMQNYNFLALLCILSYHYFLMATCPVGMQTVL
jgi:hypothetical protein